ncbi:MULTISPECIES: potassium-transporting ATPase subunit F [Aeromicrobium]|uniref:Potassium-transporting ATPase subunit F n=2 Tax=Aeromicrobium TaxID=2040 RepID=A0A838XLD9_9ACTN|nr:MULTISPECIES: potassium-transporting ATPase subunit F [Aeromicrobium]MBA4609598.1 potassium-transporting ATPase subunit F [Aeromicrobium phoceense]SKB09003.1 K+-transporting ATPase, KdpF subunit [Aeromicrobium choanae]
MSIESGLMTAVVIVLAIYLLAALILPERFQ